MSSLVINFGLPLAYILIALAFILAIAFPVYFMLTDLKKAKASLIGVGAVIVVYVVCHLLASGAPVDVEEKFMVSEGTMKFIDASIYVVYVLLAITLCTIIFSAVSAVFKK